MALDLAQETQEASRRFHQYSRIVRWLLSGTFKVVPRQLALPPALALVSFALEVGALFVMVRLVARLQPDHRPLSATSELATGNDSLLGLVYVPSPLAMALAVPALLLLAGIARYASRTIALGVEKKVARALTDDLLSKLGSLDSTLERWALFRRMPTSEIARAANVGPRISAAVVRLSLYKALNFFYLTAGLIMLAALSPPLLMFAIMIGLIGLVIAYPLNLRALRIGQAMEESATARAAALRQRLHTATGAATPKITPMQGQEQLERSEANFLDIVMKRLQVVELSNLVFSAVVAVSIGAFFWILVGGHSPHIFSYANLLVLLFALRYTLNGVSGIATFFTSVNRYLPNIMRLHALDTVLEGVKREIPRPSRDRTASISGSVAWALGDDCAGMRSGTIDKGGVYLIACPLGKREELAYQLLEILKGQRVAFSAMFDRLAETRKSANGASSNHVGKPTVNREAITWIQSILEDCDIHATPDQIAAAIAGENIPSGLQPSLINLLADARRQIDNGSQVISITTPDLLALEDTTNLLPKILDNFKDQILFIVVPWHDLMGEQTQFADCLFVSNGQRIVYAQQLSKMDSNDWRNAKQRYNAQTAAGTAEGLESADDIELSGQL